MNICVVASTGHTARLLKNGTTPIASIVGPAAVGPATQQILSLAALDAGDWLAIEHLGSATLRFGPTATDIVAAMI
ncbi:hypothetical protein D3C87_1727580 [compost metagenome]